MGYILGIDKELDVTNKLIEERHEYCVLEVTKSQHKVIIILVYIPPTSLLDLEDLVKKYMMNDCIIMGDFNARIGSFGIERGRPAIRKTKDLKTNRRGQTLISLLKEADYSIMNGSTKDRDGELTFIGPKGCSVIDLCLVSQNLKPDATFEVFTASYSHHFPIKLELGVTSIQPQPTTRIQLCKWNAEKKQRYNDDLDNIATYHEKPTASVNEMKGMVLSALKSSGMTFIKQLGAPPKPCDPKWFDKSCKEMKQKVRRSLKMLRMEKDGSRNDDDLGEDKITQYKQMRRTYRNLLKAKKIKYFNTLHQTLANAGDSKSFYAALRTFHNKFQQQPSKMPSPHEFYSILKARFDSETSESPHIDEKHISQLDCDFTMDELKICIQKLATNKAAGPDTIPNEAWKQMTQGQLHILLDSINQLWNSDELPEGFTDITIIPIYKKGDSMNPDNYRPISLVNTILKLITMLITNRLNQWCDQEGIMSDYQAAYRKGFGCEDHIFALNTAIQIHTRKKKKMYALFVDLSMAFDSVDHNKLWSKMRDIGISSKVITFVQKIYTGAKAKVRTPEGESDFFQIKRGILQGETLSPFLFTLFMEDIVKKMEESSTVPLAIGNANVHILLFADDISLLARNSFDLNDKIRILKKFFEENNLKINLKKTNVLRFHTGRDKNNLPEIRWGDEEQIEYADEYKYLGVTFKAKVNPTTMADQFIRKGKMASEYVFKLFYNGKIQTLQSRLLIYNSLCKSVLLYCVQFWGLFNLKRLEVFQNLFLRRCLHLPRHTSAAFLRLETNIKPMAVVVIKHCLNYINKLLQLPSYSLRKQCLNASNNIREDSDIRFNWLAKIDEVLDTYDCNDELTSFFGEISKSARSGWIDTILMKVADKIRREDLAKIQSSPSLRYYNSILNKENPCNLDYLQYVLPWDKIALISQLRFDSPVIRIGGKTTQLCILNKVYDTGHRSICLICGRDVEDLKHILFDCPIYNVARTQLAFELRELDIAFSKINSTDLMCKISAPAITSIYKFFMYTVKAREANLILN